MVSNVAGILAMSPSGGVRREIVERGSDGFAGGGDPRDGTRWCTDVGTELEKDEKVDENT